MSNFSRIAKMTISILQQDNRRLKAQIDSGNYQPGYVQNCKNYIASNQRQIEYLKKQLTSWFNSTKLKV